MPVLVHPRFTDQLTPEEIAAWQDIPVAVAVDVSNAACQIDPAIRPLCPPGQQPRLFGRAVTARCEPPDFGAVLYALDTLQPGDVLVIAANAHTDTAMLGEILGGFIRQHGGRGVICDGAVRDVAQLAAWHDLPVFARAITPRGPVGVERGDANVPVQFGGRTIHPGDLLLGDDDGLASLMPADVRGYIAAARAKLALEEQWQASIGSGATLAATFGLPPAKA